MSKALFEAFNKQVDLEELQGDIKAADEQDTDFEDVPHGEYKVVIEKMEQVMTKAKPPRPMVSIWFTILEGKLKGQKIFMNQVIEHPYSLKVARDFITSLESGVPVTFEDYVQFYNNILDVFEEIEGQKEFLIEYSDNKGYDKFEVLNVFDVDGEEKTEFKPIDEDVDDEDLPF